MFMHIIIVCVCKHICEGSQISMDKESDSLELEVPEFVGSLKMFSAKIVWVFNHWTIFSFYLHLLTLPHSHSSRIESKMLSLIWSVGDFRASLRLWWNSIEGNHAVGREQHCYNFQSLHTLFVLTRSCLDNLIWQFSTLFFHSKLKICQEIMKWQE